MLDDWVPRKTAELDGKIEQAKVRLAETVAKKELLALLGAMQDPATDVKKLDELNEQVKASLRQYPQLAQDRDVKAPLEQRFAGEAQRVRFVRLSDEDVAAAQQASDSQQQIQFVVWDEPAGPPIKGNVFLALARGVLYAFDANGNHLWSRRLGIDSNRVPLAIPASANSPAAFLAVSSQENSLLALAQSNGRVLWR